MFSINWRRPESVSHPQVWLRFERTTKDGKLLKFKVQDVTDDRHDDVLDFMLKYYMKEEPWSSNAGVSKDPISLEVYRGYVRQYVFPQKATVICLLDEDDGNSSSDIIGCNLLGVSCKKDEADYSQFIKSKQTADLLLIYSEFKKYCPDPFEKYNVEEYLGAFGLCVHPDFRGLNISTEILRARIPLLKAFRLSVSSTDFTAIASQKSAYKAGFKVDASVSYEDIRKATGFQFKNCIYCKMMTLVIE
ncbi:uncharacterized protein LOC143920257 isoform X2 [Arctopsyche grandis]